MMIRILGFFALLILHPVHVTLTSIDHVADTDSLKVFVRMYYDDFLTDYRLHFESDTIIDESRYLGEPFPGELMDRYLDDKIMISVNNKELHGKLLNMDLSDNEISANLLFRSDTIPEIITVRNFIMTNLYSDQANMTIIRIDDFEEGVKLTSGNTEMTFTLK